MKYDLISILNSTTDIEEDPRCVIYRDVWSNTELFRQNRFHKNRGDYHVNSFSSSPAPVKCRIDYQQRACMYAFVEKVSVDLRKAYVHAQESISVSLCNQRPSAWVI